MQTAVLTRNRTVDEWLEYQASIHPRRIELGLDRIARVARNMAILPFQCPVITVAGTNGKGSTVAMLDAILRAGGYKTASYTSPHLHSYNERIKMNGVCVADDELCRAFAAVEANRGQTSLSFFEFGTLAALYCFCHCRPDVVILETGLGGRLDAVNIVDADVAVITAIDIEHVEWLGKDRQSIGKEKAGIARKGRVCICGDLDPPTSIKQLADSGVLLRRIGQDFSYRKRDARWDFHFRDIQLNTLQLPALFGDTQLGNASCVLAALMCLRDSLPLDFKAICRGLCEVKLKGRFQIETIAGLTGHCTAIFDIAHNPKGVEVMAANLACLPASGNLHAVFSIFANKDVHAILEIVGNIVDYWYVTRNASPHAVPTEELCQMVGKHASTERIFTAKDVAAAYRMARNKLEAGDKLLTFGSVITVAEALTASQLV